jgi:type I restriction enzyme S subunit
MSSRFEMVDLGRLLRLRRPDVVVQRDAQYQFAGVKSFGGGVFRSATKAGTEFSYRMLSRVRENEFVYPKLMAWEGGLGVVPADCDGFVVSPEFCVFEIDRTQVEPRWLDFFFKQPHVWPALAGGSAGTNMRRRRIYPEDFLRFRVPLPALPVQQEILGRLDRVFRDVEQFRTSVGESSTATHAALLAQYHRISDGAPRQPMSEAAPLVRRAVRVAVTESYPELGVRSFGRGTFHKPPLPGSDVGSKKLFEIAPGDLIFNVVFAWEGAVAVAKKDDEGRVGSHRFLTCVPKAGAVLAEYLCFHFLTAEGLAALGTASPGGAGRNRTLGLQAVAALQVPVPPIESQRAFVQMLHLRDEALERHDRASERCDALVPALLRLVFEGNVGVPRASTAQAASILSA